MNFERVNQYHQKFFLDQTLEKEVEKNTLFFETIYKRGELLKQGQIIFDDPLDMEAVSTPYLLNLANLLESPNGDPEWFYMVSRNGYLVDLGILFAYTKEEIYFEVWKKLLFDFIEWQESSPHVWRSLDVGLRLNNWMKSFIYFSNLQDRLTNIEKIKIEEAITKQIIYLKENFPTKNYLSNWGVLAIVGILATAQLLPELVSTEVERWGWHTLKEALKIQFFDDGIHWEQSPMYHHEVVMCVWQLWLNSQYLNLPFEDEIEDILQKAIRASTYYCDQNFGLLPLHDSDAVDFTYIYNLYSLSGFLDLEMNQNPGIFYIGKKFEVRDLKPLPTLFSTGESGFLAYKDSNIYLTLFNGRHGSGHGHASLGSLTLKYKGKELFKDPGRYTYMEEPLRINLKEEYYHSSLMIDETPLTQVSGSWTYDSMAEPLFHHAVENTEQVVFEIAWKGNIDGKIVIFKRKIIFLKEFTVFLVINTSEHNGRHSLTTRYQMGDELDFDLEGSNIRLKGSPFVLKGNEQAMIALNNKVWSPKYNESDYYKELTLKQNFENYLVSYECLYPEQEIAIEKIDCYQNKQLNASPDEFYFGLKLTRLKDQSINEYYHSSRDTFLGDKLYISKNGRLLYGKDKFYKEKIGEIE